jgi:hypothetical protein
MAPSGLLTAPIFDANLFTPQTLESTMPVNLKTKRVAIAKDIRRRSVRVREYRFPLAPPVSGKDAYGVEFDNLAQPFRGPLDRIRQRYRAVRIAGNLDIGQGIWRDPQSMIAGPE